MPPLMPVTVPVVLTLATAGLLLLQLPPLVASASADVLPAQNVVVPVMAATVAPVLTVTVLVAVAVPQALVSV